MAARILVIGNRNYSSWSLRPWLFMKQNAISFEEVCIPLYQAGSKERLLRYSPSGKVPVLVEGEIRIWDSLAILEYLAETHPGTRGWPAYRRAGYGAVRMRRNAFGLPRAAREPF